MENNLPLRQKQNKKLLDNLYKNFSYPSAFTSVEPLLKEARKYNPKINRNFVGNYLRSQHVYTKHRKVIRKYKRLATFSPGPNTVWQADLGVMIPLVRQNKGYNYYLICVDCFSRMIFIEPIKRKFASHVIEGFENIFKKAGNIPWKIITDAGKEFTAQSVQNHFARRQIQHFCEYTSPKWHAGMAERANRTVRERLYRYFTEVGNRKWLPVIQKIVDSVNNSTSRVLCNGKFTPLDIHLNRKNSVITLRKCINFEREKHKIFVKKRENSDKNIGELRPGTRVRIERQKNPFQKGYIGNFTDDIFTIERCRKSTIPITYQLRNCEGQLVKGWFYRHDLSPVFGPQGKREWKIEKILSMEKQTRENGEPVDMALVKWRGFDSSFNSWIPASSIKYK